MITETEMICNVLKAMKTHITEVYVQASKGHLSIFNVSHDNTLFFHSKFVVDSDEEWIELTYITDLEKALGGKEKAEIKIENGRMKIERGKNKFAIPLIVPDTNNEKPNVEKMILHKANNEITIKSDELKEAIDCSEMCKSDTVRITIIGTEINFLCFDEIKSYETTMEGTLMLFENKCTCRVNREKLKPFVDKKLGKEIILGIGMNYPLIGEYKEKDKYDIKFLIAPVVDNDGEG